MSGAAGYWAGLSAEEQVARQYAARGHLPLERRWRGKSGEIDLIVRDGAGVIFVEVKKSRSLARAAERLLPRQIQRLQAAAEEYLAQTPTGLATPARFDLALVDGIGQIHILENVLWG